MLRQEGEKVCRADESRGVQWSDNEVAVLPGGPHSSRPRI